VDAEILLVDEALAVGDSAFQFKCLQRLEEMLASGVTILLVTHDIQLVKSYCNRAIYLKKGHVAFDGDCEPAAERYLTEVRDAEARQRQQHIAQKGGSGTSMRFGSDRGSIQGVRIGSGLEERAYFRCGERVWVRLAAQVSPEVRAATLVLQVRDLRGQAIYSLSSRVVHGPITPAADGTMRAEFGFDCELRDGDYSIIVALHEAVPPDRDLLIEKLVSAVLFQVLPSEPRIVGICNLGGSFAVLDTTPHD
jgi:lipopolysaccharide transport system ATP-binding protein